MVLGNSLYKRDSAPNLYLHLQSAIHNQRGNMHTDISTLDQVYQALNVSDDEGIQKFAKTKKGIPITAKAKVLMEKLGDKESEALGRIVDYFERSYDTASISRNVLKQMAGGEKLLVDRHVIGWTLILSTLVSQTRAQGDRQDLESKYRYMYKAVVFMDKIIGYTKDAEMQRRAAQLANLRDMDYDDCLVVLLLSSVEINTKIDTTFESGVLALYDSSLQRGVIESVKVNRDYSRIIQSTAFNNMLNQFRETSVLVNISYANLLALFQEYEVKTIAAMIDKHVESRIHQVDVITLKVIQNLSAEAIATGNRHVMISDTAVLAFDSDGNIGEVLPGEARSRYGKLTVNNKVKLIGTESSHSVAIRSRFAIAKLVTDTLIRAASSDGQDLSEMSTAPWWSAVHYIADVGGENDNDYALIGEAVLYYNASILHYNNSRGTMNSVNKLVRQRLLQDDFKTIEQDLPLELVLNVNDDGFVFGQEYMLKPRANEIEAYLIENMRGVPSEGIYTRLRVIVG